MPPKRSPISESRQACRCLWLSTIPAQIRAYAGGIAAVIVGVALERVLALDQVGVGRIRAGEEALRAADSGVPLEIVLKLGRLLVGAGVLVAHASSPSHPKTREEAAGAALSS